MPTTDPAGPRRRNRIISISAAGTAALALSAAGVGAFAAPAFAATSTVKHPIRAVTVCPVKGRLGWTAAGKRYICAKPRGWRYQRWIADPPASPKPPAPTPPSSGGGGAPPPVVTPPPVVVTPPPVVVTPPPVPLTLAQWCVSYGVADMNTLNADAANLPALTNGILADGDLEPMTSNMILIPGVIDGNSAAATSLDTAVVDFADAGVTAPDPNSGDLYDIAQLTSADNSYNSAQAAYAPFDCGITPAQPPPAGPPSAAATAWCLNYGVADMNLLNADLPPVDSGPVINPDVLDALIANPPPETVDGSSIWGAAIEAFQIVLRDQYTGEDRVFTAARILYDQETGVVNPGAQGLALYAPWYCGVTPAPAP